MLAGLLLCLYTGDLCSDTSGHDITASSPGSSFHKPPALDRSVQDPMQRVLAAALCCLSWFCSVQISFKELLVRRWSLLALHEGPSR